jgi:hypothetical protein
MRLATCFQRAILLAPLALATVLMVSGKKPDLTPPQGWLNVSDKEFCAVQRGAVALGTDDGVRFVLGIEGVAQDGARVRPVQIGATSLALTFSPAREGVAAELDSAAMGALLNASTIEAYWMPGLKGDLEELPAALEALQACGVTRAHRSAAGARRREFANRLAAAGAIMRDREDPPATGAVVGAGGGVCFKRREWTSGFNKNCVYSCTGSEAVQTIGAAQLCPLTINR